MVISASLRATVYVCSLPLLLCACVCMCEGTWVLWVDVLGSVVPSLPFTGWSSCWEIGYFTVLLLRGEWRKMCGYSKVRGNALYPYPLLPPPPLPALPPPPPLPIPPWTPIPPILFPLLPQRIIVLPNVAFEHLCAAYFSLIPLVHSFP